MPTIRLATFNLENLDDIADEQPSLDQRIRVMRPQLERAQPDILCLQEVNGQELPDEPRQLLALDQLIAATPLADFEFRAHTTTAAGEIRNKRNLVILSRFPFIGPPEQIKHQHTPQPQYRRVTANPPDRRIRPHFSTKSASK